VELQSSRRDKDPGIDIRELAENKLEKPLQKCGGFSVNCCNFVVTARIKSASGSTDKTYRLSSSFNCCLIERACSMSIYTHELKEDLEQVREAMANALPDLRY
jgi:hypothetical protein